MHRRTDFRILSVVTPGSPTLGRPLSARPSGLSINEKWVLGFPPLPISRRTAGNLRDAGEGFGQKFKQKGAIMSVIKLLVASPFIGSEATARLVLDYLETRGHTIGPIEFEPDVSESSLSLILRGSWGFDDDEE